MHGIDANCPLCQSLSIRFVRRISSEETAIRCLNSLGHTLCLDTAHCALRREVICKRPTVRTGGLVKLRLSAKFMLPCVAAAAVRALGG